MICLLIFLLAVGCWLWGYTQPLQHFSSHLVSWCFRFWCYLLILLGTHDGTFILGRIVLRSPCHLAPSPSFHQLQLVLSHPSLYELQDQWNKMHQKGFSSTVLVLRMAHRKRKETKQQPSMLPGPAVLGCCLVYFHILWALLNTSTLHWGPAIRLRNVDALRLTYCEGAGQFHDISKLTKHKSLTKLLVLTVKFLSNLWNKLCRENCKWYNQSDSKED